MVPKWCSKIEELANIASSQPHAACTALTHGEQHKWSFLQCTVPGISDLFKPLEDCIRWKLIPAITGRMVCSDLQRDLLSLPARSGGLGVNYPVESDTPFRSSEKVVAPLTNKIVNQVICAPLLLEETTKLKAKAKVQRRFHEKEKLEVIRHQLPKNQQRLLECAQEKGVSN